MELELKLSEEVTTVEEFLDSIRRENSRFKVYRNSKNMASLRLTAKMFDFFASYGSPAVLCVQGIVNSSVINNLNPSIELKQTVFYKLTQYFLIGFHGLMFFLLLNNFDILWMALIILSLLVFLGFNHLLYKMGESIFLGKLADEITYGKKVTNEN